MLNRLTRLLKNERGQAATLTVLLLILLLGITGLVIDGGSLYMTKSHLQKTANAAALSGAQELLYSEDDVQQIVEEIILAHQEQIEDAEVDINLHQRVDVALQKEINLGFARLFGMKTAQVEATAAAQLGTIGSAIGAAPLGIDESISLNYNQEYTLKVDEKEVESGNFGILALGGPGANTYEDNLKNGYQNEINLGDILDTQTGNIVDKTKQGVQARLNACPYHPGETHHRDCPRILLIPVYKPQGKMSGKSQVEVTGFAYFYLLEPMDDKDKTIKGMFIERTGQGTINPDSLDRGAYGIRLTQ